MGEILAAAIVAVIVVLGVLFASDPMWDQHDMGG